MLQYIAFVVTAVLILSAPDAAVLLWCCAKKLKKAAEHKAEEKADAAMHEGKDGSREFDEGFENIMRFSVNGRTGFEQE